MQILSIDMEILGPPSIYMERFNIETSYLVGICKFWPPDDKLPPKVGVVRVT